eukprot:6976854-Pyramimonas_sp.AAC.1
MECTEYSSGSKAISNSESLAKYQKSCAFPPSPPKCNNSSQCNSAQPLKSKLSVKQTSLKPSSTERKLGGVTNSVGTHSERTGPGPRAQRAGLAGYIFVYLFVHLLLPQCLHQRGVLPVLDEGRLHLLHARHEVFAGHAGVGATHRPVARNLTPTHSRRSHTDRHNSKAAV